MVSFFFRVCFVDRDSRRKLNGKKHKCEAADLGTLNFNHTQTEDAGRIRGTGRTLRRLTLVDALLHPRRTVRKNRKGTQYLQSKIKLKLTLLYSATLHACSDHALCQKKLQLFRDVRSLFFLAAYYHKRQTFLPCEQECVDTESGTR